MVGHICRKYVVGRLALPPSVADVFGGEENIFLGRAPRQVVRDHITVEVSLSPDNYVLGGTRSSSDPLLIVSFWTLLPSGGIYSAAFNAAVRAADSLLDYFGSPETYDEGRMNSCVRESSMELSDPGPAEELWFRIANFYRVSVEEFVPV
jgi:hypothetical protein